jgi:butyrate kinase
VNAFATVGGGTFSTPGGTFDVDETWLHDARTAANGAVHPANLGSQMAAAFAEQYGAIALVVSPQDTDEFCDLARMTGVKGVYRKSRIHILSQRETAVRHAKSMGKKYEDCNFVVCHIGGGISVGAHCHGRVIDGNDVMGGSGPMTPTRAGDLPAVDVIDLLTKAGRDEGTVRGYFRKSGGFMDHEGTSDGREIQKKIDSGDKYAKMLWDTMVYQIAKWVGSMAVALEG